MTTFDILVLSRDFYWANGFTKEKRHCLIINITVKIGRSPHLTLIEQTRKKRKLLNFIFISYLHARLSECPRRCSWSHRSRPGAVGHSWRKPRRWCRRWCCHGSRGWAPGLHVGRTACRWRRRSLWRRRCRWGRTLGRSRGRWMREAGSSNYTEKQKLIERV